MLPDWTMLSDELQITLSHQALRRAARTIAEQADALAREIEFGAIADRGGPEALRLFAAVIRATDRDPPGPVGHA